MFGCLCYATALGYKHIFDPRAMPCVFMGYTFAQKGYKIYNLESKTFIVSRDVVFHENIFPFKISFSIPYQLPFVDSSLPFIEDHPVASILNLLCLLLIIFILITIMLPTRHSGRISRPTIWTKDYIGPTFISTTPTSSSSHKQPTSLSVSYAHLSSKYNK